MIVAPLHPREGDRIAALLATGILDTGPEPEFDRIAEAARAILGFEIGLISLIDDRRQWFKARSGAPVPSETLRDIAFCTHAILQDQPFCVPDASLDQRFSDNPLVVGELSVRAYAGAAILSPSGLPLGTVCGIDPAPQTLQPAQIAALRALADATAALLERRRVERQRAAERLRRDAGFDTLLESLPGGLLVLDEDGGLVAANQALLALLGLPETMVQPGTLAGRLLFDRLVATGDLAFGGATDPRAFPPRFEARQSVRGTLADGTAVECLATPVVGGGTLFLLRDIGAELAADRETQALRQGNALLRRAIDTSFVGVMIADATRPDHPMVFVNRAFTTITGYPAEEVLGRNARFLQGPEADPAALAAMRQALRDRAPLSLEMLNRRRDGTLFWAELQLSPVVGADGEVRHFIALQTDISARRAMLADLEAARRAAEAASEAKSNFLASMSHEIRTPLNGVIGMTQLLLGTALDAEQRGFAQAAMRSAELLLTVLNDILDIGRLEAGQVAIEGIAFDLATTVTEAVQLVAPAAAEKSLRLVLDLPAELRGPPVQAWRGDPARLAQVLLNLVGNAVKFTERGQVTVAVRATAGGLRFVVSDTGPGLDAATVARLFETFTQADGSNTRRFGGAGLGLAIARQVVALMGGQIGVESTPGEGARFWFELPLQRAAGSAPAPRPAAPADPGIGPVLIVEDNGVNREIARQLLGRAGVPVVCAESGPAGVAAAAGGGFAAILMDIEMPGMDGIEATRQIRALGGAAGAVPVVALTAHAMFGTRERMLEAGLDGYLAKPFKLEELVATLREAAAAAARRDAAAALPLLNTEVVDSLVGLPLAAKTEVMAAFAQDAPRLSGELATAILGSDAVAARAAAHALAGAAAGLGARRLAALGRLAEAAALAGDLFAAGGSQRALAASGPESLAALANALGVSR